MNRTRGSMRRLATWGLLSLPTMALASPATAPDPLDRAARALTAGMAASDADSPCADDASPADRRALADAAAVLENLGAKPASASETDLAAQWRKASRHAAPAPLRGRGLGPGYRHMRIAPAQVVALEQIFMGGELARVVVAPGPGARLMLSVTDRDGQTICHTQVSANPGACDWTPVFTSRHRFQVRSTASTPAEFVLLTN